MSFVAIDTALHRVARNFAGCKQSLSDAGREADRDMVIHFSARCDAIVQTWAEVTDQEWQAAFDQIMGAIRADLDI